MMDTQTLHARFLECTGAGTDTRAITTGQMFLALKGPNFDANRFALEALAKGARYAVVDDPTLAGEPGCLLVPDVLEALQQLATHHRRRHSIPVIAITGSNGKTTTKELVHAVMSADRPTLATSGNLNNHIGVPLTLLRLNDTHRIAIVEMGANKPGDISELMAIAEPTHGLITNVGKAHLEGFGSLEGVVRTKTELYRWLGEHRGMLFVNATDELLMRHSEGMARVTYGDSPTADVPGGAIGNGAMLELRFFEVDGTGWYEVETQLIGAYNATNAMAAVCIGRHFGVNDDNIADALAHYTPSNNRSEFCDTGRNHLILDAYNANPTSMAAALKNFASMTSDRPKLAILGDMLELGPDSPLEHSAIVGLVEKLGLQAIYVGPEFALAAGLQRRVFPDAVSLAEALKAEPFSWHMVLVKGSRGIKLETVVEAL